MSSNLEIVKGIDDALVNEVKIKVNTQEESIKVLESVFLKKGMRSIQWEGDLEDEIEKDFDIKKWSKVSLLPKVLKEPQKFSDDDIPPFAREYCLLVAKSSQAPIEYLLMTLITMISSLIGKMIKVQPKKNDDTWIVVVNLWGLLIGDPSSLKTPMMNYILSFLDPHIKSRYDDFIEQNECSTGK